MIDRQYAFDRAVAGIVRQGEPSSAVEHSKDYSRGKPIAITLSYYRSESAPDNAWALHSDFSRRVRKGLRCPVGLLIDDACYTDALEGWPADHPKVLAAVGAGPELAGLLRALQIAHDDVREHARFVDLFLLRCRLIAERFDLSFQKHTKGKQ